MAQDDNPKPTAHVSLTHTIQELRDLVFNIALPKTEKAKTVKVPTDTLHALRDLATSILMGIPAQGSPSKPSDSSRLDAMDRQLADIQACLVTSAALPPSPLPSPQKRTYAATLATLATDRLSPTSISPPHPPPLNVPRPPCVRPAKLFDFTLVQKSSDRPVLANLTEYALTEKVFEALCDADCRSDYRAHLSGSDDSDGGEVGFTTGMVNTVVFWSRL